MSPPKWEEAEGHGRRSGGMAHMDSFAAATDSEEEKLAQPCFEGYLNGAWWEVSITEPRSNMFLTRFHGLEGEDGLERDELAWVPIDNLRLRARRCDDWDCGILRRGVDVSVYGRHPKAEHIIEPTTNKAWYDAKIVQVTKTKHRYECVCKFFVQFYSIDDTQTLQHGVRRPLLAHIPPQEVAVSSLSVLQQPGITPLHAVFTAHTSGKWSPARGRWSNDAYFLTEIRLNFHQRGAEEEIMGIPQGGVPAGMSEGEGLANAGGRLAKGQHSGATKSQVKVPVLQPTTRYPTVPIATAHKFSTREGKEEDRQRGNKSIPVTTLKHPDRGVKRKHDAVEEKETSNVVQEDISPVMRSAYVKFNDQKAGHRVTGTSHEALHHKDRGLVDQKRARKLRMVDSESSPESDGNRSASSEDLDGESGHNNERGINRDRYLKRGRQREEEQQPGKSRRYHHEHRSSGYDVVYEKASEPVLKSKGHGSRKGKSPDLKDRQWQVEDIDQSRFPTHKAEKRNSIGRDPKPDKQRAEETMIRKRGRPRKSSSNEWIERGSPAAMKENEDRSKPALRKTEDKNGWESPDADLESPNNITTAFGGRPEIETGREMSSRRESRGKQDKLPEKTASKRSSDRLQRTSPVQPTPPKTREPEKEDNGDPNTEEHASERDGGIQSMKLRSRVSLKSKKPAMKPNRVRTDADKERVVERPLYMDLLVNNDNEDDNAKPRPPTQQQNPEFGLNNTWDPIVDDGLSDSECNVVEEIPQVRQKVWSEFDVLAAAEAQALPINLQEDAQPEVHDSDDDPEDSKCDHKLFLKEDVGYVCGNCGIITTPIEDVVPQVEMAHRRPREADFDEWDIGGNSPDNQGAVEYNQVPNGEVGSMLDVCLPPHYAAQMHPHQKEGFEFLWRNLGQDAEGNLRNKKADRNAGCILSHAPGTGKSFLIISFLKSYMDRFPGCQPLIVAPKIMLLRWEKEFQRWKSDIRVWILNTAMVTGKRLLQKHIDAGIIPIKTLPGNPKMLIDMYRGAVLFEWKRQRSVCLVSYNLFSSLTDEEGSSKTAEGELVRNSLRDAPGILILDEGHFPRNKDTRIRKALMKVKTNARILLSGTLFQNNFEELFNTLYLVRPGFVEAFSSCDLGVSSDMLGSECDDRDDDEELVMEAVTEAAEKKARKLFVEEIGTKIEEGQLCKGSVVLQHGLQRLQRLTTEFVHHHTGEVLACLPGLRDFGIVLKPTPLQCTLLEIVEQRFHRPEEYLKREIAVSETSIHPKLLTKLEFVKRPEIFGSLGALTQSDFSDVLKKGISDPQDGVKTKFVFDLLNSLKLTSEKVLIFSQHITPLEMLEDMFKTIFNWDKSKDVLRLDGSMAMNDREFIIEVFNNPNSQAKVLLASTKACGEGINLVGASRVVFLDVLWNPAVIKQAISRAFRLGQKKTVYVYRLIAFGTIEEKKYKKAIRKDWLSMSIFSPVAGEASEHNSYGQTDGLLDVPESTCPKIENLGEEVRAWEVSESTCEDPLLEKLLKNDKGQANSFVKVVEHGSQFHNRKTECGPDVREWFVEDWDKDLCHTKETREDAALRAASTNPEILASKLYQDFGEIGSFDASVEGSSDTDEEIQ